ncbi:hypothetical protein GCM10007875_02690 [Limnobacter litoralis]|uniref:Uncharacterized protein n=1 Tax=Limnobacter litoralis TaxID=481366 RepID=A0ABQ5YM37_9BURK|nr:hypothetical protein GCM10007875_02690 [Limnobacter litoralis]
MLALIGRLFRVNEQSIMEFFPEFFRKTPINYFQVLQTGDSFWPSIAIKRGYQPYCDKERI